jgi:hypothetical protein
VLESGPNRIVERDLDLVRNRIWVLGCFVLIPVECRNRIGKLLWKSVLNGLYLLYTSQNLLGTIFRVTFTVFYRRIWNIVGKYSILCCDRWPDGGLYKSAWPTFLGTLLERPVSPTRNAGAQGANE